MKKMGIKTAILAILAIIVLVSLVGCIRMQQQEDDTEFDELDELEEEVDEVEDILNDEEDEEMIDEAITDEETDDLFDESDEETPEEEQDAVPVKEVTEGQLVSFPNLKATDPDGDPIVYTFSKPLNEKGQWQTRAGDAGQYDLIITASDGTNTVMQRVNLIVHSLNKAPVITVRNETIIVDEGQRVDLGVIVKDPDGDDFTVKYEGWMKGPTKDTTFTDAGEHEVIIIASDGKQSSNKTVKILVNNVNRAPKIEQISDVALTEGEKVIVKPAASDPDGDSLTFEFSKPLNQDGTWATKEGDAGKYRAKITASDGSLESAVEFFIIVESKNMPPVITLAQSEISVDEGDIVTIDATVTDPDNDPVTITYSGWMTSNTYQTNYDDSGVHIVTITAFDGKNKVSKDIKVIVRDKNRPPVFDPGAFT